MTWVPVNNTQIASSSIIPNAQGGTQIAWTSLIDNVAQVVFTNNVGVALTWVGTGTSWAPINNTQ